MKKEGLIKQTLFPLGKPMKGTFTGEVWMTMAFEDSTALEEFLAQVTFAPFARSHWHYHHQWQVIVGVDGMGWYAEAGKKPQLVKKGEIVKIPPETKHWHGATTNSHFVQLVMMKPSETVWLNPVSDEEFKLAV